MKGPTSKSGLGGFFMFRRKGSLFLNISVMNHEGASSFGDVVQWGVVAKNWVPRTLRTRLILATGSGICRLDRAPRENVG